MAGKRAATSSPVDMQALEQDVRRRGYMRIAGLDEAGRGPLAGPVVSAAVVLPPDVPLPDVKDSKQLTASRREACYDRIFACALDVGIACVDAVEIDRINILRATFQSMAQAVSQLSSPPDYLLIDGPYRLPLNLPQDGVPGGDGSCLCIAAASIVAKVTRDRLLLQYHELYPQYGFDKHKGYGTAQHLAALRRHGPCPIHRLSFRGVVAKGEPEA